MADAVRRIRSGRCVVGLAVGGLSLVATACDKSASPSLYNAAATKACLERLPRAVSGLPPANPPDAVALFVYSYPRDRFLPRARAQLAAWDAHKGRAAYAGMTLTFFKTPRAARSARKSLVSLYGGMRLRNVVVAWTQSSLPRKTFRMRVLRCLHGGTAASAPKRRTPRASLATFAGAWGGHTRGLRISADGRAFESTNSGCCFHVYDMTFQIQSVSGTLTRATAVYRVTSFKRYHRVSPRATKGEVGKLLLRNGIVTNTLTKDFFCSNPAWGATGACGA